ncbi:MAG: hypothetical protein HZA90_10875 [Verrucomicrobia bacterium]|nr:hypothetical protein [Verrucomicrobiota bacterium]
MFAKNSVQVGKVFRLGTITETASLWIALSVVCGAARLGAADYSVVTTADAGPGSLRQAIISAESSAGLDRIVFNISGASRTIRPFSPLPTITDPVIIDGTTQPGFAGKPLVELDGSLAGGSQGLVISAGNSTVRGLVVNRFALDGLVLQVRGTNRIEGNFIGTDLAGTSAAGNGAAGILVMNCANNTIGGTNAAQRNVISGGNRIGIYLFDFGALSNVIQGNFIGTTTNGALSLGNQTYGINIVFGRDNRIGGTAPGAGNVISGNGGSGIYMTNYNGAGGNVVQGNIIGLDASGSVARSNGGDGVSIEGASNDTVGGPSAAARNIISGNSFAGVRILGVPARSNVVQGNYIGTDATGRSARPNAFAGVTLSGTRTNLIGGSLTGQGNVISGNLMEGVFVNTNSLGNRLEGNLIGLDATGTNALPNTLHGVVLNNASWNIIGGTAPGAGNVISGNNQHGVWIARSNARTNLVQGNFIGPDITGRRALKNAFQGVLIDEASDNVIGGSVIEARNVISGNGTNGVWIVGANAARNTVQGNYIGTDVTGTAALGNEAAGVGISDAPQNRIGGDAPSLRNVIAANRDHGVFIVGTTATRNVVQGNFVGTDVTGTQRLGNWWGVYLEQAHTNILGGPGAAGNLISGNNFYGVLVMNSSGNTIQGNLIGTQIDGTTELRNAPGNPAAALELTSGCAGNLVGGTTPGEGNIIAFAPIIRAGVRIRDGAVNNVLLGNSIFGNNGLGIDLGGGIAGGYSVSPNDACDGDTGANLLQNFPVLTEVVAEVGTRIRGSLNSVPNRTYRLQFFANPAAHSTGYGEGRFFLGETMLSLGAACDQTFTVSLPASVPAGFEIITATATEGTNNTSEFSAGVRLMRLPVVSVTPAPAPGLNFVGVAWSNAVTGLVLKETDVLPPAAWRPVTNGLVLSNNVWRLDAALTNAARFFRLFLE